MAWGQERCRPRVLNAVAATRRLRLSEENGHHTRPRHRGINLTVRSLLIVSPELR